MKRVKEDTHIYHDPSRHYTVDEYYALTDTDRGELINGLLYDMAPPTRIHQGLVGELYAEIRNYIRKKQGDCHVYPAPFGVLLDEDEKTVLEPDISVICDPGKLNEKGCVGAPDWVIEVVSPTDPAHDYIYKLKKYFTSGVREYWIVDPGSQTIAVYHLEKFRAQSLPDSGIIALPVAEEYTMADTIKAGIYDDLEIDFREISKFL
ncbi:MAG: Uma2 family endonuclease [Lachnospiraceae bacterium]|nr:Uma2 family endonuclease [Lachnospiraceae bacterium]